MYHDICTVVVKHRGNVIVGEAIRCEGDEKAGLANSAVADDHGLHILHDSSAFGALARRDCEPQTRRSSLGQTHVLVESFVVKLSACPDAHAAS